MFIVKLQLMFAILRKLLINDVWFTLHIIWMITIKLQKCTISYFSNN